MKPVSALILLSILAACGAPATVATVSPTPAPPPAAMAAPVSTEVPPTKLDEAPRNWQLLDESIDHVPGISSERAMKELLAGKAPKRTVLVAIIDNGIDTNHVDLKPNLWQNPKEIGGNKRDDDNNGFVDDLRGWNFIGNANGEDVQFDTFEVTRQYARCHGKAAASGAPRSPTPSNASKSTPSMESSGRRSRRSSTATGRPPRSSTRSYRSSLRRGAPLRIR